MHSRMGTTLTAFLLRMAHWLSVRMTHYEYVIKVMLIKSLRTPQIIQYFELSGVIISD